MGFAVINSKYVWGKTLPLLDSQSAFWCWNTAVPRLSPVFAVLSFLFFAPAAAATTPTLIVGDDRGGGVIDRAQEVQRHRKFGTQIEIRGSFCMSTCTMYLALSTTCIAPGTVFGFHGPSSEIYGVALSPTSFERWSQVMAEHYPEPLRDWFLTTGRHRTVGFHRIQGSDLIALGVPRCGNS